ncbi:hypothetical protein KAW80_00035 [Candidatus Babeliales bacterium]|nr:hypothetical protein [Candidatus Babeliales bacterium]
MKKIYLLILLILNTSLNSDIINGSTDTVGRPRDLSINPIYIGFDHSQTTSIKNHTLTHLSGSEALVTFTTSSHLVLEDSTLSLDSSFTFSHGTIDIVGTVNIEGSGKTFNFGSVFLRINSSSRLRIGEGVTFVYTPTSKTKGAIQFYNDDSVFELDGATLKVDNSLGLQMNIGTLEINGNSIIDNASTDTLQALILGYGTATNTDGPLKINSGAKLTIKNAGLILRNLENIQGDGTLVVERTSNFIIEQNLDLNNNNFNFSSPQLSSKVGKGAVSSVDSPELYGKMLFFTPNSLDWRPQDDYLIEAAGGAIYDKTLTQTIAQLSSMSRIVNWDPYGRYIAATQTESIKGVVQYDEGHNILEFLVTVDNGIVDFAFDTKFSPDGRYFLCPGIESGSTDMLYLYKFLPEESSKLELATNILVDSYQLFEWSPNGRYLAALDSVSSSLNIYDFDETPTTKLITTVSSSVSKGQHGKSIWSPDGRHFAVYRTVSPYVIVYNFDGTTATQVASNTTALLYGSLTWSPDGRGIAIGENNGKLSVFKFDGSSLTPLNIGGSTSPVDLGSAIRGIVWSKGGEYIAIARTQDDTSDVNEILIHKANFSIQPAEASMQNIDSLNLNKNLTLKDVILKLG